MAISFSSPMLSMEHEETLVSAWCHHNPDSICSKAALVTLICAAEKHLIPQSLSSFIMLAGTLWGRSGNVGTHCSVSCPKHTSRD